MMKTIFGGAFLLAVTLAAPVSDLAAQQGRASGPGGAEALLRMRERLELTEEQVARLDVLREERVARRAQETAELSELRSSLRAGTIERAEAMERMRTLRESRVGRSAQDRESLESVLDEGQRATLDQLRAQRRAFEAGRRVGMRDRGRGARAPGGVRRDGPSRAPRPGIRAPRGDVGPRGELGPRGRVGPRGAAPLGPDPVPGS